MTATSHATPVATPAASNNSSAILATSELEGGCLCGGVKFVIARGAKLRPLVACHCEECRKLSGSFVIATKVASAALAYKKHETLSWYPSSSWARRGFCQRCGSQLFYQMRKTSQNQDENQGENQDEEDMQKLSSNASISIMLGALAQDHPALKSLPFVGHIFTSQAHPALESLSSATKCERWGEQSLVAELAKQGWNTDKDAID